MIVQQFLEVLPEELKQFAKPLRIKARETGVLKESVAELGNDIWLSQELNINRQQIEEISRQKLPRL